MSGYSDIDFSPWFGSIAPADIFAVLANPVRRQLLERLCGQPLSAGELSNRFDLSRPAVAEHLKVLRDAGLVADEAQGRRRIYRVGRGVGMTETIRAGGSSPKAPGSDLLWRTATLIWTTI